MNPAPSTSADQQISPELEPVAIADADRRALPELRELLFLVERLEGLARVDILATLRHADFSFPQVAIRFGPDDPTTPVLALFGGVHGLERIGTRVVTAYLQTILELARWDRTTQAMLNTTRLLMIPLVNPVGMCLKRRSNGNRVDLMRNAPVQAEGLAPWHLFGGHRISPRLPWYRGEEGAPMETEVQAVCDFVRREVFPAKVALSVDVHSGYGKVDRFWFPYAKTRRPFPGVPEALALKHLLDRVYPNHIYRMEPQSYEYLAHGDLWDFLYDEYRECQPNGHYIPFTLELGSWMWVKKNWSQLFSLLGIFNPRFPHRVRRTLRRHVFLFDFLYRAVQSSEPWSQLEEARREHFRQQALKLWYGR
ncbi:MAG TPA: DUF2817 domain-containing protein [Methylococcaceae bacterium]|jgi:hypothetical protein|nr:DUF2817 domain-containing protein [Methylococcaceae bacterium]